MVLQLVVASLGVLRSFWKAARVSVICSLMRLKFSITLHGYGIGEFCSGCENKIGCFIGEWDDGFNIIGNVKTSGLRLEFALGSCGEFFDYEKAKFCESPFTLWLGFPF